MDSDEKRKITLAIHTFEYAVALKALLENEGIEVELNNINLSHPVVAAGVRVRINEGDLPRALRIVENKHIFTDDEDNSSSTKKIILVPTDFSPYSMLAVKLAFKLAVEHKCEIVFLHTYIDPSISNEIQLSDVYSYDTAENENSIKIRSIEKKRMAEFLSDIKNQIKNGLLPGVKFSSIIEEGVPEEAILNYTHQNNPFLLIMVTRDAERKERDLIGSVSAEVLDSCRTTTITIPSNYSGNLFATDIDGITFFANLDQTDILGLDNLFGLFPEKCKKITLTHLPVRKDRHINTRRALNSLEDYCKRTYSNCAFESIHLTPESISKTLSTTNSTLLVVSNKKKNIFARLFNPGLAHKLLFRTDVPMMAIPV